MTVPLPPDSRRVRELFADLSSTVKALAPYLTHYSPDPDKEGPTGEGIPADYLRNMVESAHKLLALPEMRYLEILLGTADDIPRELPETVMSPDGVQGILINTVFKGEPEWEEALSVVQEALPDYSSKLIYKVQTEEGVSYYHPGGWQTPPLAILDFLEFAKNMGAVVEIVRTKI